MWTPNAENQKILEWTMAKIKSVPYPVTSRWSFYQLVQAGLVKKEKGSTFEYLIGKARKEFFNGWYPGLLIDSVRECDFNGEQGLHFSYVEDTVKEQEFYTIIAFEAQAMFGQFRHHTKDFRISLVPFRGDASIPLKWKIAKKLEQVAEKYNKPIQILYFGDFDKKGLQIFQSALNDIRKWCSVGFNVQRIGLTLEQAESLSIPENPNKPGNYQWEALDDKQAGTLILSAVQKYCKKPSAALLARERSVREACTEMIADYFASLEGGK